METINAQATFFNENTADEEQEFLDEQFDYEEVPLLLVDTDPERAVARQKELMEVCFDGIGEERKPEKRLGLAMQQLDIEQRHALRLLLIYPEEAALVSHLQRCLAEPAYGYGERGDQGRTIAQAMAALGELPQIAASWLASHRGFQQRVLGGRPFSFRSLFDFADLDSFSPLVQRVGDMTWRLGVEGEGKVRDFPGEITTVWPHLCDTYVQWSEADNEAWLTGLKRQAAKLPDTIQRAAWADRLRKERHWVEVKGNHVILHTERDGQGWPRFITLGDQVGLSRLSGHSFFEVAWAGGWHLRRFEISGTTRQGVPFEHIELAHRLAEVLATEVGLSPEPAPAEAVEAAYLRRLKATGAILGSPQLPELPSAIQGKPVAEYRVNNIGATLLQGSPDFAYIAPVPSSGKGQEKEKTAVLLQCNEPKGTMVALPVVKGRPRRGHPLMTTPLVELDLKNGGWLRALASWGIWLVSVCS